MPAIFTIRDQRRIRDILARAAFGTSIIEPACKDVLWGRPEGGDTAFWIEKFKFTFFDDCGALDYIAGVEHGGKKWSSKQCGDAGLLLGIRELLERQLRRAGKGEPPHVPIKKQSPG